MRVGLVRGLGLLAGVGLLAGFELRLLADWARSQGSRPG